jgi:glycosyltransferase involved in cell wall biosynthesis
MEERSKTGKIADVTAVVTCMTDEERPFLRIALESVIGQTVPCQIRLYVSTENTWVDEAVAGLPGIIVRRVPMMPVALVRNTGVSESNTEWIALLDGDDVWMPNKLERQLAMAGSADFVGADHELLDEKGDVRAYGLGTVLPMPSSWLVRRKVFLRTPFEVSPNGYDEDSVWWTRTQESTRRVRVPEFLIGYRVRSVSVSTPAPSKRRKLRFVQLGGLPVIGSMVRSTTWVMHALKVRTSYPKV